MNSQNIISGILAQFRSLPNNPVVRSWILKSNECPLLLLKCPPKKFECCGQCSTKQFVPEPGSLWKGFGYVFVRRKFCERTAQNGRRTKAGHHRGGGILPFDILNRVWYTWFNRWESAKELNHMKKGVILKVISILFALMTLLAISCAITGTESGFLDLSNIARAVCIGIAVICGILAVITWKYAESTVWDPFRKRNGLVGFSSPVKVYRLCWNNKIETRSIGAGDVPVLFCAGRSLDRAAAAEGRKE